MPRVKSSSVPRTRRERAKATRERVIHAARRLFASRGYTATTMAAVAKAADVAVQTVYFLFNTKAQLLGAVLDTTVTGEPVGVGEGPPRPRELVLSDDPHAAIERLVDASAAVARRMAPYLGPFRAAAAADPALADLYRERVLGRRQAMHEVARGLAARGALRRGLDPDRAGDIVFAVAGGEIREVLIDVAGWTEDEWRSWVIDTLAAQLLEPRPA